MALHGCSHGDWALQQSCISLLVQRSQGREYSIVLLWGAAHSPLHPAHPDWGASPTGASAADSCKKHAKIAEPESTWTTSIKLAKVGFWEGSDLFVSVLVDCLFYRECLLSLKNHFRCFLSKKQISHIPIATFLTFPVLTLSGVH